MKTDTQLQQDVIAELSWEPALHAEHIGVEVRDGVVTLAGNVASYAEKGHAEEAVQRVGGVKAVAIALKVQLPEFGRRTDADIARSVETILGWTNSLPADGVKVLVEGGWVTVTGLVDWQYQRQTASDAVRHLPGVTGLSNQISLQPALAAVNVKTDIEAALKRRAAVDAATIGVAVAGADITLTGTVQSWSERDLATASAWASPGVRNVVDHMTIKH